MRLCVETTKSHERHNTKNPRQHRRRNEAFVHGLRHERNHWTSAARRARRLEAGPSPRAVRHEDDGARVEPRVPEVREDRRRGDGQLSPARRCVDLRHARAAVAGLQHAVPPGRRAGQLRIDRRRSARGDAVHRGAPRGARRRRDGRPRQGDRRLRAELRRDDGRADRSAGANPESSRQRLGRHRGRHGDQRAASQSARSHRRSHLGDRDRAGARRQARQERETARPDEFHQRPRLPDRRLHRRAVGHRRGIPHRPRRHSDARQGDDRAGEEGRQAVDHHHGNSVSGEQGPPDREDRRPGGREDHRGHLGPARRIRSRRHAHRHRAEARAKCRK